MRILIILLVLINVTAKAQTKTVFKNNVSFTIPTGWYMKDSSANRIMLRKTGDTYSKIEIKIYEDKEKDLVKYTALDKKKFSADKHTRTVLADATLGGKKYKRIKYFNTNTVVIANTETEYTIQFKPKVSMGKEPKARLETTITYNNKGELAMLKDAETLVTSYKL
jgi:hypothetical protein